MKHECGAAKMEGGAEIAKQAIKKGDVGQWAKREEEEEEEELGGVRK